MPLFICEQEGTFTQDAAGRRRRTPRSALHVKVEKGSQVPALGLAPPAQQQHCHDDRANRGQDKRYGAELQAGDRLSTARRMPGGHIGQRPFTDGRGGADAVVVAHP